jgi:hypothetical protein
MNHIYSYNVASRWNEYYKVDESVDSDGDDAWGDGVDGGGHKAYVEMCKGILPLSIILVTMIP